jgi:ABC-2 type transport system permease protein
MSEAVLSSESRPRSDVRPRGTSFAGLVGVELRRLWWRRLTRMALVATLLFVGFACFSAFQETRPSAIAERVADYNRVVADMKQQLDSMPAAERQAQVEECRKQQAQATGGDPSADFDCDQINTPPSLAQFGLLDTSRAEMTRSIAQEGVYLFGFLAFLVGASFVAAEFSSGAIATWLTFCPKRLRVAGSKLVAALLGGLGLGALAISLTALGAYLVTTANRPDGSLHLPDAPVDAGDPLTLALLRVLVAVTLGGLGGAALGLLARSTAGVIGFVAGYAVLVEGFLAHGVQGGALQPWFVGVNIDAFVRKGATYFVDRCGPDGCSGQSVALSYTHGWVYLLVLSVVGVGAAPAVFRRRDVG